MEVLECKHCDHCKQPFEVTKTKVVCATCKANFCNSKCKKEGKREHKKCTGRQAYEPPKPEQPKLPNIEDVRVRSLLYGDDDKFACGYKDENDVMQPATVPERAIEIMAHCYRRFRDINITKVPKNAEERKTGVLRIHFNTYIALAECYLSSDYIWNAKWELMSEDMTEKLKDYELGEDYFAISFTIGKSGGPYVLDRVVRFLYRDITQ